MRRFQVSMNKVLFPTGKTKILLLIFIALLLPAIYYTVYITGGIKYVYSHSMYIPILLAGIIFGLKGGAIVALVAGILLGPFIPINTISGEQQLIINWIFRVIIFLIVGILSGYSFDVLRKKIARITELLTHHPDTEIPNSRSLSFDINNDTTIVISIIVNNYNNIICSLGKEIFVALMKAVYLRIKDDLKKAQVVQSDSSKIWVCLNDDMESFDPERISKLLNAVFILGDIPMYLDFSMGIACCSENESRQKSFQQADIAAYHAKQNHLQYSIFDESQMAVRNNNLELLGAFPRALETNQTELYYQPKINLKTREIVGIEALIRWNHPVRGFMLPQEFIKAVEETQLINPMTAWVLNNGLLMIKEFQKMDMETSVSINISAKNLQNPRFLNQAIGIIKEQNVACNLIEFEMTESSLIYDPEKTKTLLQKIRDYHIALSIDDFGTGYSSLAYLRRFPINAVKIDKFFIQQMNTDLGVNHIVRAAIDLAHNLNLTVIAEGVENFETEQSLIKMNCDMAQGYYYTRPLNGTDIISWYQGYNTKARKGMRFQ
ncbi:MAG: GGDEF domain-containing phosphodiesterase [Eubacteriales bacterium]|nr:GGDEF domain-containing phosphodiesterase [Eubacteriales bacterium]